MTTKSTTPKITIEETLSALIERNAMQEKAIKDLQSSTAQLHNKLDALATLTKKRKDGVSQEEVNSIVTKQTEFIKTELNVLLQRQKMQETELNKTLSALIKTVTSDVIRHLPETKNKHSNHYSAGIFVGGILLVIANIFAVTSYIMKDINFQELTNARHAAYVYQQHSRVDSAIVAEECPKMMPLLQKYRHAAEHVGADSAIHTFQLQRIE